MKTRNASMKLIAMVIAVVIATAVWTIWGANRAEAIIAIFVPTDSFGVGRGQTARLNVLNRGEEEIVTYWSFLDAEGTVLREAARVPIGPGHTMSFDLNGDAHDHLRDAFGRIQLRAVVSALRADTKNLGVNVEVFDNDTGKTTFALGATGPNGNL